MMSYLLALTPLVSKIQISLELLNDGTELVLIYHMMVFSDWIKDTKVKEGAAYSFNAFIFTAIAIHLSLLVYTLVRHAKAKMRQKQCCKKKKPKKVAAALAEQEDTRFA